MSHELYVAFSIRLSVAHPWLSRTDHAGKCVRRDGKRQESQGQAVASRKPAVDERVQDAAQVPAEVACSRAVLRRTTATLFPCRQEDGGTRFHDTFSVFCDRVLVFFGLGAPKRESGGEMQSNVLQMMLAYPKCEVGFF